MSSFEKATITREKASIKARLDDVTATDGRSSPRLRFTLEQMRLLGESDDELSQLQRYIFGVSALVHHERFGGLSPSEVEQIVNVCYNILQMVGIKPRSSNLAALYGDLHLIRSQIYRKEGNQWRAAWEQETALTLSGSYPSGGEGFQMFVMANRSLRLGQGRIALQQLSRAGALGVPEHWKNRLRMVEIQTFWLCGMQEKHDASLQALDREELSGDLGEELTWHKMRACAWESKDLTSLFNATKLNRPHDQATYILELCLWAMCHPQRKYLSRMPSLDYMAKNKRHNATRLGAWFSAVRMLKDCYDRETPLPIRLRILAEALEMRNQLLTLDKEILLLGAAIRLLARSKAHTLALLVYGEFARLCLSLTGGLSDDPLGLLYDIKERDWFKED